MDDPDPLRPQNNTSVHKLQMTVGNQSFLQRHQQIPPVEEKNRHNQNDQRPDDFQQYGFHPVDFSLVLVSVFCRKIISFIEVFNKHMDALYPGSGIFSFAEHFPDGFPKHFPDRISEIILSHFSHLLV